MTLPRTHPVPPVVDAIEPQSPVAELMPDALPDLAVPAPYPAPEAAPVPYAAPETVPAPGTVQAPGAVPAPTRTAGTGQRLALAARWARVLSAFLTAQVLTQVLGLGAGLVLVRTMAVHEFALYTLALSVVTFFTFASDLGSTTSLLYFFHRTAGETDEFALYFAAVRSLRRWAFLAGAAVVMVALPRAAAAKGYGALEIALATAGVLACVWFQIRASLSVLTLRLADRYTESYVAEIAGGGLRLASAVVLVWTAWLLAWLAVLGNALAIGATAALARPTAARLRATAAQLAPYRRKVLRYLLPTLPSALYFSVQGPLVVWLAATFGAARNIAEVGALTRLGLLFSLFSNLSGIVLLPRLARLTDERVYRTRFLQFGALLTGIALALWLAVATFPHPLLAILGQHYSGLDSELRLVVCGSGLTLVGGYLVGVNLARSWTRWQGLTMLALAATQLALVKALPLGTTSGVLTFNVLSGAASLVLQVATSLTGFLRPRVVHWE